MIKMNNLNSKFSIETCSKEDVQKIVDGLNQYNLERVPAKADTWHPMDYIVRDENGVEIGGVLAGIGYWNGLEVKMLWVKEGYRRNGLGSKILKYLEQEATKKGAEISMLDTFDFQAENFYLKNGYQQVGEIKGFPKGHKRIYFSKWL